MKSAKRPHATPPQRKAVQLALPLPSSDEAHRVLAARARGHTLAARAMARYLNLKKGTR